MRTHNTFAVLIFSFVSLSLSQDLPKSEYICPMYCTDDVSLQPGICSACKMDLEDRKNVENPTTHKIIFPKEAWALAQSDSTVLFLDVRSEREYKGTTGHIRNALLIPVGELEKRVSELEPFRKNQILTYCSHGIRSARAARILQKHGYLVKSVVGGTTKWIREKLPLQRIR